MTECFERPCETGIDLMGPSAALRQNLQRFGAWLGDLRVLLFGLLIVMVSVTLVTVLGGRVSSATLLSSTTSLSGDDLYDPAAGSRLALLSAFNTLAANYSGDDAYDPAAGARPARAFLSTRSS